MNEKENLRKQFLAEQQKLLQSVGQLGSYAPMIEQVVKDIQNTYKGTVESYKLLKEINERLKKVEDWIAAQK
jgi:hypothetical protein